MEPNIILIVCDALRKDVLGLYGGPAKTPNLKKLAKDAMVYENAIAPSPWTFPSHVSLFTGLYPSEHGVHETKDIKLPDLIPLNRGLNLETLPEYLTGLGYNTVGVSNNIMMSRFTGFDIKFSQFLNIEVDPWLQSNYVKKALNEGVDPVHITMELIRKGQFGKILKYTKEYMRIKSVAKAINFPLDKGADLTNKILFDTKLAPNLFLFINYFEAHEPYKGYNRRERWEHFAGIKKLDEKKTEQLKRQYILEVEYLDKKIGELIEMLKLFNLYDNSMIIITSDHGQAMNEHGYIFHDCYLYDEIIRIPLIIKYPNGRKFRKKGGYQSLVRIFELVKDIIRGRDDNKLTDEFVFSEVYGLGSLSIIPKNYREREYIKQNYEKARRAIYKDGFKLVVNGTDGSIEEFLEHGIEKNLDKYKTTVKELILELKKFNKDGNFKFPS